jgi:hypothetical protein
VEIMLRCAVADRPGALAELAGVIGGTGADIESLEVVHVEDGTALDDLVCVVRDPQHLRELLAAVEALPQVEVVHASLSRGHPGDAVTRLAVGLEAIITGAMPPERGLTTLLGGLLHAEEVVLTPAELAPAERKGVMVVPFGEARVALRRSYAFSATERSRALALLRICEQAVAASPSARL